MSPVVKQLAAVGCIEQDAVELELDEDLDMIAFPFFVSGSSVQIVGANMFFITSWRSFL